MENEPLVIERLLNAPVNKVWKAITDKEDMKQWYFDIPLFKPEIGVEFQFSVENEGKQYLHLCKITEVIVDEKLAYTWRYNNYPGNSTVIFELFSEDGKTRLRLTHAGLETFPVEYPELAKENFVEGWTQIISTSLKEFVERAV